MHLFLKRFFFSLNFFRNLPKKPVFISLFLLIPHQAHIHNQTPPKNISNQENKDDIDDIIMKFSEMFLKNLVIDGLFHSNQLINEGSAFVELLSEQEILQKAVTTLILTNLKTPDFYNSGLVFSKNVVSDLVAVEKNKKNAEETPLEKDLNYLILKTLRDPDMKTELLEVVKWLMDRKEIKEGLIDLFAKAVTTDERIRKAFTNALKAAFFDILMNKITV